MRKLISAAFFAFFITGCVDSRPIPRTTSGDQQADPYGCGPAPYPIPAFAVVPGTYPGQGPNVCLPTEQYEVLDGWWRSLWDWSRCVELAAIRQGDVLP